MARSDSWTSRPPPRTHAEDGPGQRGPGPLSHPAVKLLRSWPRDPPEGRPHVIDGIERFIVDGYDYRRLAAVKDDVVLIEWDLAVDPEQVAGFIARVRQTPERVRVAPYRLYYQYADDTVWGETEPRPVWAHRRYTSPERLRWVVDGDDTCHLFGFGLTYIPAPLIAAFCADIQGPLGDSSFSRWHFLHAEDPEVVIDWECRPVHLNHPQLEV